MGTTTTTNDDGSRLGALLDRAEIDQLVHRLGACLDEARFDDVRSIVIADATASTPGGVAQGVEAVVAQAARNHSPDERIQHAITDLVVTLEGDTAQVRANVAATFGPTDGGEVLRRMGGVYTFGARRTADGWRLSSIAVAGVWREGELPVPVPAPG